MAFARHIGVFDAIEECDIEVDAICGTSSGSMVGALYAAGYTPDQIAEEFAYTTSNYDGELFLWKLGKGLFYAVRTEEIHDLLPKILKIFPKPMGIGLCTMDKRNTW